MAQAVLLPRREVEKVRLLRRVPISMSNDLGNGVERVVDEVSFPIYKTGGASAWWPLVTLSSAIVFYQFLLAGRQEGAGRSISRCEVS